jgi:DNA polymerase-4
VPAAALVSLAGEAAAAHLKALARGDDDRSVVPSREAKSISEERTYTDDVHDPRAIDRALLERAEGVARELRRLSLVARTVHLKVRTGDFTTWTRASTLRAPTDLPDAIVAAARGMMRERIELQGRGVRLLGVGVSALAGAASSPAPLFPDAATERARKLARASAAVKDRLGEGALTRGSLLVPEKGEASSLPSVD